MRRKISRARNKDIEQQKINNKQMPKGYWSLKLAKEKKTEMDFRLSLSQKFHTSVWLPQSRHFLLSPSFHAMFGWNW